MSSKDNIKNKLVNSMRMTKSGTATTTTATGAKQKPVTKSETPAKEATPPSKKPTKSTTNKVSSAFPSRCRVWPD